jgi:hypothetical protein
MGRNEQTEVRLECLNDELANTGSDPPCSGMPRGFFRCAVLFTLVLPLTLLGQSPGVIDDPDGFTNLRAEPDSKSAIVATVRRGEVFTFVAERSEWYKVTLASGKKGYMHSSRIRFHATMEELADTKPTDEVNTPRVERGLTISRWRGRRRRATQPRCKSISPSSVMVRPQRHIGGFFAR